ncbi:phosphoesterase RecJ-like protein [Desulfomicrobium macestii]|uniref:Phosphoesterase RecJ domain-containing protein n=2 Tax=Desulfomicrobium TaxID=898 RepID=A0A8G2F4Q4_DESNO|nr:MULTISPECIES: bifunctional oligoribonuclease/PAP phosphatase NrnA [Desulfomicrobium]MBE1423786.1 phosphoesterase RecJ-like protein [Desulfomicrobium macestii]SFL32667.1 phosphoesterase RecJ domain-containing protein [Desulfomicrobium norvegicum]
MPLLKQIAEQLRDADNFLVLAHVSPDGDALGSMLAMGELLDALGKKVVLFNESGIPRRFEWLTPKREILTRLPEEEPDNLIVLDCGSAERAGELIAPWLKTKKVFNIDHHLGNPMFGTLNWVEQRASSVGEMVGMLARKLGVPLVGLLGEYVYLALISDTGDFCFNNTRPETLEMAAEILRLGLLPGPFHEQKQSTGKLSQLQMRGTVLQQARLYADGQISLICFTRELFEQTGTGPEDTEGLVNTVLYVNGVQVAISLREEEQGIKFSLRSKSSTNVQTVAFRFGGGGHRNAAGGTLLMDMEQAKATMIQAVTEELGKS